MKTKIILISGMTCGSCVEKVRTRLLEHPELESATVSLKPPQAELLSKRELTTDELNTWLEPSKRYHVTSPAAILPKKSLTTYKPLVVLLFYLIAFVAAMMIANGEWDGALAMRLFMGGFFITFSFFKMLDLSGFRDAYRGYDIIAKIWPGYGLIYPFIELVLGIAYLANASPLLLNITTAAVMGISLIGVLRAVVSKTQIRCACLGTVFQLPMSQVTIIEDGLMLAMAVLMIFDH